MRFGDRDLPLVNIKGEILYNNWQEMFQNQRYLQKKSIIMFIYTAYT